jgi:hypothetical protein
MVRRVDVLVDAVARQLHLHSQGTVTLGRNFAVGTEARAEIRNWDLPIHKADCHTATFRRGSN